MTKIWLDGTAWTLAPTAMIGQGGEAEIFDLGDGRVVKLFKGADHDDFVGQPPAQAAARDRLAEHQHKLRELPVGLPATAVTPTALALTAKRGTKIVGYAMPKVAGTHLLAWGEPRWRRDQARDAAAGVAVLLRLHELVAQVHAAGAVIGDFNDLNVLVDGVTPRLIDVDSWQFGRWRCGLWTERHVDPRLCVEAGGALALARPHDVDSDWFAFAVIACRTLLGVGPYGGVFTPAAASRRIAPALRPLAGIAIFDPDVVYPRAATPWRALPDEVIDHLRAIFVDRRRGVFPRALLERLAFLRCAGCGLEHTRSTCPRCAVIAPVLVTTRARLTVTAVDPATVVRPVQPIGTAGDVWRRGDTLYRETAHGADAIGTVIGGETRAWATAHHAIGFYRVGALTMGFWFRPDRGGLADGIRLPAIRGLLVSADAAISEQRAWLSWRSAHGGRLTTTVVVVDRGEVRAVHETPADWTAGIAGACALGPYLFVPTDAGIVRIEEIAGALVVTRTFPDTAEVVTAADTLAPAPRGLHVLRSTGALRLELT